MSTDRTKLKELLQKYGVNKNEIENFMDELDQEDFSPYSQEVITKLKETPEGRAIIKDMPKTDKAELMRKIKEHLEKKDQ